MLASAYEAYDSVGKRKYLTATEGVAFLEAASKLPRIEELFCKLMFYSGCRISEALLLTKGDVDVSESVIRVRCLKKRGKLVVRRIPLPPEITARLASVQDSSTALLWSYSRMSGWRIIKKVMKMAGVYGPHACPKGLRHGFGVRAALANIPVSIIQRWMGHSYASTTGIYLAVRDDEERDLMTRTWS